MADAAASAIARAGLPPAAAVPERPAPSPAAVSAAGGVAGGAEDAGAGLLPLFAWLSPAFPVGAYAYSHALEWAVEAGDVRDGDSLAAWLADLFRLGFPRTDGILFLHAHAAAAAGDAAALQEVNALAVALAPSAELRLEACQQGRSLLDAVSSAWPAPMLARLAPALAAGEVAYPVALGLACAAHGVPPAPALEAYLLGLAQNLVSAAIRLAPIGQTAGARVVAGLAPQARTLAAEIPALTLDDVGSATFRADLGSFRHETQYTRLFRS